MSLELTDVWAGYVPGVDILRGLSLKASPGEIVTIIGPNGSGKSTSLKVAAGYLRAHTGSVAVGGQPVGDLSVDRRVRQSGIAIVPQSDNVFGALTVWENLDLGGTFMPAQDRRRRMEELLEAYPMLRRKLRDRASSLSGAAIARGGIDVARTGLFNARRTFAKRCDTIWQAKSGRVLRQSQTASN